MSPVSLLKRPAKHHGHSASELKPVELDHLPLLQKPVQPLLLAVAPTCVPNFPLGHSPAHWLSFVRPVALLKRPLEQRPLHLSLEVFPVPDSQRPIEHTPVHCALLMAFVAVPNRPAAHAEEQLDPPSPVLLW